MDYEADKILIQRNLYQPDLWKEKKYDEQLHKEILNTTLLLRHDQFVQIFPRHMCVSCGHPTWIHERETASCKEFIPSTKVPFIVFPWHASLGFYLNEKNEPVMRPKNKPEGTATVDCDTPLYIIKADIGAVGRDISHGGVLFAYTITDWVSSLVPKVPKVTTPNHAAPPSFFAGKWGQVQIMGFENLDTTINELILIFRAGPSNETSGGTKYMMRTLNKLLPSKRNKEAFVNLLMEEPADFGRDEAVLELETSLDMKVLSSKAKAAAAKAAAAKAKAREEAAKAAAAKAKAREEAIERSNAAGNLLQL